MRAWATPENDNIFLTQQESRWVKRLVFKKAGALKMNTNENFEIAERTAYLLKLYRAKVAAQATGAVTIEGFDCFETGLL